MVRKVKMRKLVTVKPAYSQSGTHSKALWATYTEDHDSTALHCNRDISLPFYMCRSVGV